MFNNIGISGDMSVLTKDENQIKTAQIKDLVDKEVEFFTGSEWKKDIVKKRELKEEDRPLFNIELNIIKYKNTEPISINKANLVVCKDTRVGNRPSGMLKVGDYTNFWFSQDKEEMYQAVVTSASKVEENVNEVYYAENTSIVANGVLIDKSNGFGFFNRMNNTDAAKRITTNRPNVNFRELLLNRMKKPQNRS